jgi:hypothetical protein
MKQANPNNTDAFLAWSREMIRKERLVGGRAHPAEDLSRAVRIEPARFAGQITTLEDLGLVAPGKLTPDTVMTTEFLP